VNPPIIIWEENSMNRFLIALFATGAALAVPTSLWAQDRPGPHEPAGRGHPMAAPHMAAPRQSTPHLGTTYHRPVTHHATYNHGSAFAGAHGVRETTHATIDRNTYHRNVTAERHFHYGNYRAPSGYEYRRWSYGERLPAIYYSQDYWLPNYLNFGLPWAPDGCEWVRFGPDAILVDVDTGEVLQVVYGLFY
jgi:Ni/Co efflux regulator RcnB